MKTKFFTIPLLLLTLLSCPQPTDEGVGGDVAVTGINIEGPTATIEVGDTLQLSPIIIPENATNKNVTYESANAGVASVNTSGLVTGVSAGGPVTITVTTQDGGFTDSIDITVNSLVVLNVSVSGISLNKTSTSLTVGQTEQLSAIISPAEATNKNVTWSSSNSSIASVVNGLILAESTGAATITVTTEDGDHTAQCNVTVSSSTVSVSGISLNKTSTSLIVGQTEQLTTTISPSNATNKNVTWSSSNSYIVSVENGLIAGISEGSATITVQSDDGNYSASCQVEVTIPRGILRITNSSSYNLELYINGVNLGILNSGYYVDFNAVQTVYEIYLENSYYGVFFGPEYRYVIADQMTTVTIVNGYVPQTSYFTSTITSYFSGFNYGNTFTLANGQVWLQTEYYYWYYYAVYPEVIIYNENGQYYMKVEGIDKAIRVQHVY